jgi:S-adenosylmethionine hydrolase
VAALPITFLSDYGYADEFAGVCRAVIARIAPEALVIDLTHGIEPGDVRRGSLALADAATFLPHGIHLAVVDPGVGSTRQPLAVRTALRGHTFVGPDNGLLWPAIERCGGPEEAVSLSASPVLASEISASFHGRDVFAPVAANLALGASLADVGAPVDPASLARPALPEPILAADHAVAHVLYADRFGNAALDLAPADFRAIAGEATRARIEAGELARDALIASTFSDAAPGEALLYEDSSGRLAVAINRGSAVSDLGLKVDDALLLRFE